MENILPFEIKEILHSKCRQLQFIAKKFAEQPQSGKYRSIIKGTGIEFEEARLYIPGDDAKRIDWKLSARKQSTYVKSFKEERDINLYLLVDISSSLLAGTASTLLEKALEISAFISAIAIYNKDPIGCILFDDDIIRVIPPSKSQTNILSILFSIINSININKLNNRSTLSEELILKLAALLKRKSIIFFISDFRYPDSLFPKLSFLSRKHQFYPVWLNDEIEPYLATKKLIKIFNPETGLRQIIDLSTNHGRKHFKLIRESHNNHIDQVLKQSGLNVLKISDNQEVVSPLTDFFIRESYDIKPNMRKRA